MGSKMSHKVLSELVNIATHHSMLEPYENLMERGEKDG